MASRQGQSGFDSDEYGSDTAVGSSWNA